MKSSGTDDSPWEALVEIHIKTRGEVLLVGRVRRIGRCMNRSLSDGIPLADNAFSPFRAILVDSLPLIVPCQIGFAGTILAVLAEFSADFLLFRHTMDLE